MANYLKNFLTRESFLKMKKFLKKLVFLGTVLYVMQAAIGVYFGIHYGILISNQINAERKVK